MGEKLILKYCPSVKYANAESYSSKAFVSDLASIPRPLTEMLDYMNATTHKKLGMKLLK